MQTFITKSSINLKMESLKYYRKLTLYKQITIVFISPTHLGGLQTILRNNFIKI